MPLNDAKKVRLKRLEERLEISVRNGKLQSAIAITADIQSIFADDASHHRLLKAKLWCFELALGANDVEYATKGIEAVKVRVNPGTKLYLETISLLSVCYLRQKRIEDAKPLIKTVLARLGNIQSARSRHLFQRKFFDRIEQECVLTELIGTDEGVVNTETVYSSMVILLENGTEETVLNAIGSALPQRAVVFLNNVRGFALQQLSLDDVRALPSSKDVQATPKLGKKVLAIFHRIGWQTLCDPDSQVFKLWSKGLPSLADYRIMAGAVAASLSGWNIGLPVLGGGIAAAIIKFSVHTFCDATKPEIFMSSRKEVLGGTPPK